MISCHSQPAALSLATAMETGSGLFCVCGGVHDRGCGSFTCRACFSEKMNDTNLAYYTCECCGMFSCGECVDVGAISCDGKDGEPCAERACTDCQIESGWMFCDAAACSAQACEDCAEGWLYCDVCMDAACEDCAEDPQRGVRFCEICDEAKCTDCDDAGSECSICDAHHCKDCVNHHSMVCIVILSNLPRVATTINIDSEFSTLFPILQVCVTCSAVKCRTCSAPGWSFCDSCETWSCELCPAHEAVGDALW